MGGPLKGGWYLSLKDPKQRSPLRMLKPYHAAAMPYNVSLVVSTESPMTKWNLQNTVFHSRTDSHPPP